MKIKERLARIWVLGINRLAQLWRFGLNLLGIGDKKPEPEEMPIVAVKVLICFATIMGGALIVSNLAALKIWELKIPYPADLFPIKSWKTLSLPVDAGIWLFPLTYVIGDLLVNTFGEKLANLVAVYASILAVATAGLLWLLKIALPGFPGVDNSAFEIAREATGRIFLASVAGFLASQLANNSLFVLIFRNQDKKAGASQLDKNAIRARAIMSSIPAHFLDSLIFEVLAFWGRVSPIEFVKQISFAYGAALIIESALSWKLTPWLAVKLAEKLRYSNGKRF